MTPLRKFLAGQPYPADLYVTCIIPADEPWLTVPCAAVKQSDGSHVYTNGIGYAYGDACFAKVWMEGVKLDHPTWDISARRMSDGSAVQIN